MFAWTLIKMNSNDSSSKSNFGEEVSCLWSVFHRKFLHRIAEWVHAMSRIETELLSTCSSMVILKEDNRNVLQFMNTKRFAFMNHSVQLKREKVDRLHRLWYNCNDSPNCNSNGRLGVSPCAEHVQRHIKDTVSERLCAFNAHVWQFRTRVSVKRVKFEKTRTLVADAGASLAVTTWFTQHDTVNGASVVSSDKATCSSSFFDGIILRWNHFEGLEFTFC